MPDELQCVAIVGVGLIGGSVASALARRRSGVRILGVGRRPASLRPAIAAGLITEATDDLEEAAAQADVVVVCTPVDTIAGVVIRAAAAARPGTLITDAGSVKSAICRDVAAAGSLPAGVDFVGAHPIAGSEQQGWEHADPELFQSKVCVVTPSDGNRPAAVARAVRFWETLGTRVEILSPERHDELLAATSHVPHLVAAALAHLLTPPRRPFTGTGMRDTTRIAGGDPGLWTAILRMNGPAVLDALAEFETHLTALRAALAAGDEARLAELLVSGRNARQEAFR